MTLTYTDTGTIFLLVGLRKSSDINEKIEWCFGNVQFFALTESVSIQFDIFTTDAAAFVLFQTTLRPNPSDLQNLNCEPPSDRSSIQLTMKPIRAFTSNPPKLTVYIHVCHIIYTKPKVNVSAQEIKLLFFLK